MVNKFAILEPVAAYDRIAGEFGRISEGRRAYLASVERVISGEIGGGARSMLDVGAGNGSRSERIARAGGIQRLVLLEPSAGMRGQGLAGAEIWPFRAEELAGVRDEFDVITCLWNVLGHIAERAVVMRQLARLAAREGQVFVDVTHRYNAAEYGVWRTVGRFVRDRLRPGASNGDVVARWNVNGQDCSTSGHVFTDGEFRALVASAGLEVRKRFVIDYSTGELRRRSYSGNLLYVLGRAAVI